MYKHVRFNFGPNTSVNTSVNKQSVTFKVEQEKFIRVIGGSLHDLIISEKDNDRCTVILESIRCQALDLLHFSKSKILSV